MGGRGFGAGLALGGLLLLLLDPGAARASIDPATPSDQWFAVGYPTIQPDPNDDHQTGIPDSDIVGSASHPAFYILFDNAGTADPSDGWIAFRVRLGADTNPPGFNHFFGVGMDVGTDGDIDFFLGVDNSGSSDEVAIWAAGSGLNISPNTTTLSNTPLVSHPVDATPVTGNYSWMAVTATSDPDATDYDLDDDGNVDHFLTFVLPFSDLVGAIGGGFDQNSIVSYVIGTSNQANALNNDLGGPDDASIDRNDTWSDLGALTSPGRAVPEADGAWLVALALAVLAPRARR